MDTWHGLVLNPVAVRLVREGVDGLRLKIFVPSEVRRRRERSYEWPLVPYAFVKGAFEPVELLRIKGVLRFLRTPTRGYACASEAQIVAMQTACGMLKRSEGPGHGMQPGDRARLRRLALGSLEATVREIRGRRIRIDVTMLGRVHEQWVDAGDMEAV